MFIIITQIRKDHRRLTERKNQHCHRRIRHDYIADVYRTGHRLQLYQIINASPHQSAQQKLNAIIFVGSTLFTLISI